MSIISLGKDRGRFSIVNGTSDPAIFYTKAANGTSYTVQSPYDPVNADRMVILGLGDFIKTSVLPNVLAERNILPANLVLTIDSSVGAQILKQTAPAPVTGNLIVFRFRMIDYSRNELFKSFGWDYSTDQFIYVDATLSADAILAQLALEITSRNNGGWNYVTATKTGFVLTITTTNPDLDVKLDALTDSAGLSGKSPYLVNFAPVTATARYSGLNNYVNLRYFETGLITDENQGPFSFRRDASPIPGAIYSSIQWDYTYSNPDHYNGSGGVDMSGNTSIRYTAYFNEGNSSAVTERNQVLDFLSSITGVVINTNFILNKGTATAPAATVATLALWKA